VTVYARPISRQAVMVLETGVLSRDVLRHVFHVPSWLCLDTCMSRLALDYYDYVFVFSHSSVLIFCKTNDLSIKIFNCVTFRHFDAANE